MGCYCGYHCTRHECEQYYRLLKEQSRLQQEYEAAHRQAVINYPHNTYGLKYGYKVNKQPPGDSWSNMAALGSGSAIGAAPAVNTAIGANVYYKCTICCCEPCCCASEYTTTDGDYAADTDDKCAARLVRKKRKHMKKLLKRKRAAKSSVIKPGRYRASDPDPRCYGSRCLWKSLSLSRSGPHWCDGASWGGKIWGVTRKPGDRNMANWGIYFDPKVSRREQKAIFDRRCPPVRPPRRESQRQRMRRIRERAELLAETTDDTDADVEKCGDIVAKAVHAAAKAAAGASSPSYYAGEWDNTENAYYPDGSRPPALPPAVPFTAASPVDRYRVRSSTRRSRSRSRSGSHSTGSRTHSKTGSSKTSSKSDQSKSESMNSTRVNLYDFRVRPRSRSRSRSRSGGGSQGSHANVGFPAPVISSSLVSNAGSALMPAPIQSQHGASVRSTRSARSGSLGGMGGYGGGSGGGSSGGGGGPGRGYGGDKGNSMGNGLGSRGGNMPAPEHSRTERASGSRLNSHHASRGSGDGDVLRQSRSPPRSPPRSDPRSGPASRSVYQSTHRSASHGQAQATSHVPSHVSHVPSRVPSRVPSQTRPRSASNSAAGAGSVGRPVSRSDRDSPRDYTRDYPGEYPSESPVSSRTLSSPRYSRREKGKMPASASDIERWRQNDEIRRRPSRDVVARYEASCERVSPEVLEARHRRRQRLLEETFARQQCEIAKELRKKRDLEAERQRMRRLMRREEEAKQKYTEWEDRRIAELARANMRAEAQVEAAAAITEAFPKPAKSKSRKNKNDNENDSSSSSSLTFTAHAHPPTITTGSLPPSFYMHNQEPTITSGSTVPSFYGHPHAPTTDEPTMEADYYNFVDLGGSGDVDVDVAALGAFGTLDDIDAFARMRDISATVSCVTAGSPVAGYDSGYSSGGSRKMR